MIKITFTESLDQLVSIYLMTSYLYYWCDYSAISDEDFDRICQILLANYDDITHPHKTLFGKEDLSAGTGFAIRVPDRTKLAAWQWVKDNELKESKRNSEENQELEAESI